jgi:hypothetical protein
VRKIHEQHKKSMAENSASHDGTTSPVAGGDPSLGPNDVNLELEVVMVDQRRMIFQQEAALRLSQALTPAAREAVAAGLESKVDLIRQTAITQLSETILKRCKPPATQGKGEHRSNRADPAGVLASPAPGDPSLGPNDVRLTVKLRLVGRNEILCDDRDEARLPDALTPPARGAAAAAIETSLRVLLKNALAQITAAVEKRFPKDQPEASGLGGAISPSSWQQAEQDDYPEVLPLKPEKVQPVQARI